MGEDLTKLGLAWRTKHVLEHGSLPFARPDFYLPGKKVAISLVSFHEMVSRGKDDGEGVKFELTGKQVLVRGLAKELLDVKLVYVAVEEYNRRTEQLKVDP